MDFEFFPTRAGDYLLEVRTARGWEPFYNQARTGFPAFSVYGGGVVNNQQIPKRWMYPQDESTLNTENLQTAIQRQYPAGDNVNGVPWLLKAE